MTDNLSPSRIKQLLRTETKMLALEAGGVDNWEMYDECLSDWRKDEAIDELVSNYSAEVQELFESNVGYEFPAGYEAGISVWCTEGDLIEAALARMLDEYKEL